MFSLPLSLSQEGGDKRNTVKYYLYIHPTQKVKMK